MQTKLSYSELEPVRYIFLIFTVFPMYRLGPLYRMKAVVLKLFKIQYRIPLLSHLLLVS